MKTAEDKNNDKRKQRDNIPEEPGKKTSDLKDKKMKDAAESIKQEKITSVKKLKKENSDLKDQLLRKMAEFDNYRKRIEREYYDLITNANESIVQKLLPVLDDLERSLEQQTTNWSLRENKNQDDGFRQGIELIYTKFYKILQDTGLKLIETNGREFNPTFHDAMMQVENPDIPSNHIVETFEKGYCLNDKVIRHAKVSVSK